MLCAGLHVYFKDNLSDEEEQVVKEDSAERVGDYGQPSTLSTSDVCYSVIISNIILQIWFHCTIIVRN